MRNDKFKIKEIDHFKRANFFTGIVATPKYWNEIQDYHYNKERLYNRIFHGFGIIPGVMGNLKVQPIKGGGGAALAIVVSAGAAIDGKGRGLFLYEPQAITIDYHKYKLPGYLYIVIKYKEIMEDYYQNEDNPDFQGYTKRLENAEIKILNAPPDDGEQIEVARIYLEEDQNGEIPALKEADNFTSPQSNSIDCRYISWTTVAREGLSPYLKEFLVKVLDNTRNIAQVSQDAYSFAGFRELHIVALTAKMLVQSGDVRFDDVVHVLNPLFDIDNRIIQEMLDYERSEEKHLFSTKEGFGDIKNAVFEMGDGLKSFDQTYEMLDGIIKRHSIFIDGLKKLFITQKMSFNDLALMSYELPRILLIGNERYTLVDFIDFRNNESIETHRVTFENNKDVSTSNIALMYPDGEMVRDTVKSYIGGSVKMDLKNLIKKRKLLLIRRTDIVAGGYSIEIFMKARKLKRTLNIESADTVYRWRNCYLTIDEEDISGYSMNIEFVLGEKGRDNFGKIWAYQKL